VLYGLPTDLDYSNAVKPIARGTGAEASLFDQPDKSPRSSCNAIAAKHSFVRQRYESTRLNCRFCLRRNEGSTIFSIVAKLFSFSVSMFARKLMNRCASLDEILREFLDNL